MASEDGGSGPLLPTNQQTNSRFAQQGSVDWVALSNTSVSFTVGTLARMSKAGVEAITVQAGMAIFSQARLGKGGQVRVTDALNQIQTFPSLNATLWFGFGLKHIVRSLSDSEEGLSCIGVCACLTEQFSTTLSAKVIRELFLLHNPPVDLRPALRQWTCLVESCEGVLAPTGFGHMLHELTRLYLRNGSPNLRASASPEAIAKVLKGLFDVSSGKMERIILAGGSDCSWIAAVAHWLFDLAVEVRAPSGDVIYRPGSVRSKFKQEPQVIVMFSDEVPEDFQIIQKCYTIPSGKALIINRMKPEEDQVTLGRVDWSTCLQDTFGNPMEKLLTSWATHTGSCLGSAARTFRAIATKESLPKTVHMYGSPALISLSYGRGFFLAARDLLPELSKTPALLQTMEGMLDQSPASAVREYTASINSLRVQCKCSMCMSGGYSKDDEQATNEQYCSVLLIEVICNLIHIASKISMQKGLYIAPTRSGIEKLYWDLREHPKCKYRPRNYDDFVDSLLETPPTINPLLSMMDLFTGRGSTGASNPHLASAISAHGLCFYTQRLCEVTTDPDRFYTLHVIPGHIQWNEFLYKKIEDMDLANNEIEDFRYPAHSARTIMAYDDLTDSSSRNLEADLLVEESSRDHKCIKASYRISSPSQSGYFIAGPQYILDCFNNAYTAIDCRGQQCHSLNGFRSHLVEGEGIIYQNMVDPRTPGPIIRVLQEGLAIWVALSQNEFKLLRNRNGPSDPTRVRAALQGNQCVRCCVINAIERYGEMEGPETSLLKSVCIITRPRIKGPP